MCSPKSCVTEESRTAGPWGSGRFGKTNEKHGTERGRAQRGCPEFLHDQAEMTAVWRES